MNQFQIGDQVRVSQRVDTEPGWANKWVDEMDEGIGRTFEVRKINELGVSMHHDETDASYFKYPHGSLELVSQAVLEGT